MSITESRDSFDCDIAYVLFVYDETSSIWVEAGTDNSVIDFIHSFDTSSGTLEVNSSNTQDYSLQTDFQIKITATSTETMDSQTDREVEMIFTLTLQDKCYHNELTLWTGIEDNTYHVDRLSLLDDSISAASLG